VSVPFDTRNPDAVRYQEMTLELFHTKCRDVLFPELLSFIVSEPLTSDNVSVLSRLIYRCTIMRSGSGDGFRIMSSETAIMIQAKVDERFANELE
jgi:hypothetical protein